MSRRTARLGTATVAVALVATGIAGGPSEASRPGQVPGVELTRYVQRDATGRVVARGATATLPGHRAVPRLPAHAGQVRVATLVRGRAVVVRLVGRPAPEPARTTTARR
ncbi:hypothetical protein H5V45_15635 [Nocardioides sp. KIGAM211]|uniref:Uncharacterized protein n=1 Tax=Nocardioides luti TaxID=2761101 RepID=A0A7X0RI56_9ACTN|nr:hypothetical protein [Nocardioides luti]MBB6628758.1 hypothetical protein [Nocardioides luti]